LQDLRDRRRQRRLAMVNVTNRPYVAVRLRPFKFLLCHLLLAPCGAGALARVSLNQNRIVFPAVNLFVVRAKKLSFLNQAIGKNPTSEALVLRLESRAKILTRVLPQFVNTLIGFRPTDPHRTEKTPPPNPPLGQKPLQNLPPCRPS